jgi:hypothetical protein
LFSSDGLISYVTIHRAPTIGGFIVVVSLRIGQEGVQLIVVVSLRIGQAGVQLIVVVSLRIGQAGVQFPAGATDVFVLQNAQTRSRAFPASDSNPGVKRPVLETHQSPPTPHRCLHGVHRDI